jgi:hypothetical protein
VASDVGNIGRLVGWAAMSKSVWDIPDLYNDSLLRGLHWLLELESDLHISGGEGNGSAV